MCRRYTGELMELIGRQSNRLQLVVTFPRGRRCTFFFLVHSSHFIHSRHFFSCPFVEDDDGSKAEKE